MMGQDMIDIGPACFSDGEKTVISYEGNNFYRACDAFVAAHADGSSSFCVKRVGHPGDVHEDFAGVLCSRSYKLHDSGPQDGFSDGGMTPMKGKAWSIGEDQSDDFVKRHVAWERAKALVDEAVEKFGIKEDIIRPSGFTIGYSHTDSEISQYLVHIQSIADWLLGED